MCYVNYVKECISFMEYAANERVSASEQSLWHTLFHLMNQRANGSDWPEGFISIPNARVLLYMNVDEKTLSGARNRLVQRGLIEYIKGDRQSRAPQYKMKYFSAELSTDNQQFVYGCGNFSGNQGGNQRGNQGGSQRGNQGGNLAHLNVNLYRNPDRIPNAYEHDDHEEEEDARAREAMGRCVDETYQRCLGRDPVPIERQQLIMAATSRDMPCDLVEQAISRAALRSAKSPALYAMELMRDWEYKKIHTVQELVEHDYM